MSTNGNMTETSTILADVFLEALAKAKLDYIFAVLGSDHPSIIEAYARRQRAQKHLPKMLIFLHEFVAISAADGYARITGKPQCVLVHVDVGTAALAQGLQNASSGKSPILIIAGQSPLTLAGEISGSRSEHVQWYQDVPNQSSIVYPYSRYTNEIKCVEHVESMVNRALLMATTGCPGPTYLTAARETLAATVQSPRELKMRIPTNQLGGLPPIAVETIASALVEAENPIAITGYLGRDRRAVPKLINLANLIPGLSVFDSEFREMSFPADHPAWITVSTGAAKAVKAADVILVLDADVPWIPVKVQPSANAQIFHIDFDSRKEFMNLFDIQATETYQASSAIALQQLNEFITGSPSSQPSQMTASQRSAVRFKNYQDRLNLLTARAVPHKSGNLNRDYLFASLRSLLPQDTVFVSDAVTNQVPLAEQLQLTLPGTNFTKGASGLGWAGGAAIGIKLATERYNAESLPDAHQLDPEGHHSGRFVCMIIGDGAFTFGSPTAVYNAAHRLKTPFLSVVLNNGGWNATRSCVNDVHPNGVAAGMTEAELGIDLRQDGPDYGGIAKAASAGRLWTAKVTKAAELAEAIKTARKMVESESMGALIDAVIV